MSQPKKLPSYRLHRPSGRAVVTLSGHDFYLGAHGSPESHREYDRLIAEWIAGGRGQLLAPHPDITVTEALARYVAFAATYYLGPDGQPTTQLDRVTRSVGFARSLYGTTPARTFGPTALKAVRETMVQQGWTRGVVNQRVGCVVRAWKWLAAEELVPVTTYQALASVDGLRQGRTSARESEPTLPVPEADLTAVLPLLPPFLADVARLQLLTCARPGEVLGIQPERIDRSRRDVWTYQPPRHKTSWRGRKRLLLIGPQAQEIVRRYLVAHCPLCHLEGRAGRWCFRGGLCGICADRVELEGIEGPFPATEVLVQGRYLFSPKEAQEERSRAKRAARKSKVQPSQKNRRAANPGRAPGDHYQETSYAHRIRDCCQKAGILPAWHPHQLRHNGATFIAAQFGLEVARIVLGHSSLDVTKIYAEDDLEKAMKAIRAVG